MLEIYLATMAFAVASFALLLLSLRCSSQVKSPFAFLLSCLLLLSLGPILFKLTPNLIQLYVSLLPLIMYSFLPALWFYHEALIAETHWQWQQKMWKHFSVLPLAFMLGVAIWTMPTSEFHSMFFSQQAVTSSHIAVLSLIFLCAVVFWCLLSCVYVARLIKRSINYRQRLKNVYSNEEGRDLKWLTRVSILILLTWAYALIVLVTDNRLQHLGISENGVLFLLALIVWLISANGLQQRPGFEDSIAAESNELPEKEKRTYQRSGLTDGNLSHIAAKLDAEIKQNKVHLDPELTLTRLSKILAEPSQYISQTLSQQLETTFFDFINKARIEDAKQMLVTSKQSVLDIALATGFNSRSSFYKAFKKFAGVTPSQFRNDQQ